MKTIKFRLRMKHRESSQVSQYQNVTESTRSKKFVNMSDYRRLL